MVGVAVFEGVLESVVVVLGVPDCELVVLGVLVRVVVVLGVPELENE